jgi:hypothetical protein
MFFVTLLLEQIVTWMRQQSGTTSLRGLLYFDEVFGFFPPVANPPSKRPLLTLLKQARAFGFGVVLTTQNPVDLDYKGLSNTGTWFIGKLQTERDKMRLLEGLETAAGTAGESMNRAEIDRTISGLGSRVFLLHNVHEEHPVVFHTRWAMSYLRGPMTRNQVRDLVSAGKPEPGEIGVAAVSAGASGSGPSSQEAQAPAAPREKEGDYSSGPPTLPPGVDAVFLPVRTSRVGAVDRLERESGQRQEGVESDLVYEPALLAMGQVSFVDKRRRIGEDRRVSLLVPADTLGGIVHWDAADPIDFDPEDLGRTPEGEAFFGPVPAILSKPKEVKAHGKDFKIHLYRDHEINLFRLKVLKLTSNAGESESDFKVRAQQVAREKRDQEVDRLRKKYERKLDRLETKLSREERELDEDKAKYAGRKREELLAAGETVIGLLGLFGRRRRTGLSTAARRRRMTSSAKADIKESEEEIARLMEDIEEMREEMQEEAEAISARWDAVLDDIETFSVKPRRSDVRVRLVTLAWAPFWEVGYHTIKGVRTHTRIAAWK